MLADQQKTVGCQGMEEAGNSVICLRYSCTGQRLDKSVLVAELF